MDLDSVFVLRAVRLGECPGRADARRGSSARIANCSPDIYTIRTVVLRAASPVDGR